MIISLLEAQKVDETVTQVYLDGLEQMIHRYTNNGFLNRGVRFKITKYTGQKVTLSEPPYGLREGDTVRLANSTTNDGLYTVESLSGKSVVLETSTLHDVPVVGETLTKVEYPADVVTGVMKLIAYDAKMKSKLGVKSESISRMSITYYDVNATESKEGYPIALLAFLDKYKMLRW